ncbi:MAG: LytR C-terminal domain-containing protein [bacterium]|nr:LytR C-terminal domain-containing protein [bacterium]
MENTDSIYTTKPKGNSKKIIIAIIVILILLIGSIFIFRQTNNKNTQTQVPVAESPQPSPTEKPVIDKKTVKIQVQNGTGVAGQAAKVVDALKTDYSQDNIKSGNAPDYNHTITTISAKVGLEDIASDIKQKLSSLFTDIQINTLATSDSAEFDVVVITGETPVSTITTSVQSPTPKTSITPTVSPTTTLTPSPTSTTSATVTP